MNANTLRNHLIRGYLIATLLSFSALMLRGQENSETSPEAEVSEEEVFELEAFSVSTDRDVGYISTNTLSGSRFNQRVLDVPQNLTVVNRELLEDLAQSNPIEALEYGASGVGRRSFLNTDIDIRGFRTTVELRDGIPYRSNYNQPLYDVERIEVLKGPSALLFGRTSNPGGLINYVSVQPTTEARGSISISSAVPDGNYSWNTARMNLTGPITRDRSLLYRLTLGTQRMEGHREFTFDSDELVSGLLQWNVSRKTNLQFGYTWVHKDYNYDNTFLLRPDDPFAPGEIWDKGGSFGNTAPWSHREHTSNRYWATMKTELSDSLALNVNAAYYKSEYTSELPGGNLINSGGTPREITGWGTRTDLAPYSYSGADLQMDLHHEYSFSNGVKNQITTGLVAGYTRNIERLQQYIDESGRTTLSLDNPDYYYPTQPKPLTRHQSSTGSVGEFYFLDQLSLLQEKLIFVGGARYNYTKGSSKNYLSGVSSDTDPLDTWVNRYGIVAKPTEWFSIYYNYSESFSYLVGFDALGNELSPQVGEVDEIGIKIDHEINDRLRVAGSLAFFDNAQTGVLIPYSDPTGTIGGKVQKGEQVTEGYELDLSLLIYGDLGNLSIVATATDLDSIDENGDPFIYTLQTQYSIWARYAFTKGTLEDFTLGLGFLHSGDRQPFTSAAWVPNFPLEAWPGYDRVDLLFSYIWNNYKFQLNVGNVLDEYYFATAAHGVSLYEGLPRNYKFSLSYSW